MIEATILKQKRKALQLTQIWESYFPTLPVGQEYWMVALEDLPLGVLLKGIKHTARKRVQLRGNMTLDQMLTYLESSCALTLRDEIAAGIYKPDQFNNRQLVKAAPARGNREAPVPVANAVTVPEDDDNRGNRS